MEFKVNNINEAKPAELVTALRCPNANCGELFLVAPRCPYCGQLIKKEEK